MTTGIWAVRGSRFSRRQVSKPSMPGIMTSRRMMSHSSWLQAAIASGPFVAVVTSKYSAVSRASSNFRLGTTSSTTRIRALIATFPQNASSATSGIGDVIADCLEKFDDGNRFGEISFATALPDLFLIALHSEGGDGDHRNVAQVFIILDPLRHLQTGDFRQLNIHQDQVRTMRAGQFDRLDAA